MATSRERTPRGQGELLRERLIDSALALIDAEGELTAVTVRAATRGAGVSPNAFYLHFDSREELVDVCLERCFAEFRDTVREGAASGDSPWTVLLGGGRAYVRFATERAGRYAVMFGARDLEPRPKPTSADEAYSDLVALVTACAQPPPGEEEADILAKGIFSGIHGYVSLMATRPLIGWPEPDEFLTRLAEAWLGPVASG